MSSLWALLVLVQGKCAPTAIICTRVQPSPAALFATKAECEQKGNLLPNDEHYCFEVEAPQLTISTSPPTDCDLMHPNMSCVNTIEPVNHPPKPGDCAQVNSADQWVSIRCP